jgi:hypothetical protein
MEIEELVLNRMDQRQRAFDSVTKTPQSAKASRGS